MKKLSTAIIFTLMAFFATTAPALANTNQVHTCDSATKVIRDYKGNPQAWKNRDLFEQSRQATLFIQTHCANSSSTHTPQQTAQVRPANSKDFYNAGYRKGVLAGQLAARRASSVTDPTTNNSAAPAPARTVYVSHQTQAPMVKSHKGHNHKGHNHHSEAERLDCELTDSLNRQAGPITTVINRTVAPVAFSKVHRIVKTPMIKHGNHSHHTEAEKADCALTDALNRRAGPVVSMVKRIH